jgi:hypothetical protein
MVMSYRSASVTTNSEICGIIANFFNVSSAFIFAVTLRERIAEIGLVNATIRGRVLFTCLAVSPKHVPQQ